MHATAQFLHHPWSGGMQKRGALKEKLGTRLGTYESYKYFRANKSYRKAPSRGFVCVSCDRAFTRNGDLRRHEFTKHHDQNSSDGKSHTGNKHMRAVVRDCPHPLCQTSSRLDNLPKHVQRRHTEVWEAVTVRNPHALWYDKCVEFYRSRVNSNYRLENL